MGRQFVTFFVWAGVGASLVFASMSLLSQPARPVGAQPAAMMDQPQGSWSRLFGQSPTVAREADAPPASPLASRLKLVGLAAPAQEGSSAGVALISIDSKPARAFKVGAVIDGDRVLQEITSEASGQKARIGRAGMPAEVVLEAALLPTAAKGTLASSR